MEIVNVKVRFNGIYCWGLGWKDMATRDKWDEFWKSLKDVNFWDFVEIDKGLYEKQYLVSVDGSVYLHPMGFEYVGKTNGKIVRYVGGKEERFFPDIDEMKELCEKCADYCGGSVEFGEVKTKEVEI